MHSFLEESSREDHREEGNKGAVDDIDGPMLPGDNDGNDSQDEQGKEPEEPPRVLSDENAKHGDRGDDVAAGDDADRIVYGDHFAVDMTLPVPGNRRPDHFGGIEIPDAPNDEEGDGDRDEVLIKVTLLLDE